LNILQYFYIFAEYSNNFFKIYYFMIKLKITLLSTLFACMAMVFVTSCEQENVNVNDALEQESEEIFNFLLESGFEMDEVTITHDFVQVNNDYGWFRSDFLSMMRGENDLEHVCYSDDEIACDTEMPLEFRQTYFNFTRIGGAAAISRQNLSDIRFFIHPSVARDCGQVWVNAALNAINAWNGISGLRVRFRRVSSLNNADLLPLIMQTLSLLRMNKMSVSRVATLI